MEFSTTQKKEPFIIKMIQIDEIALSYIKKKNFFHIEPQYVFTEEEEQIIFKTDQLQQQKYVINRTLKPYYDSLSESTPIENIEEYNMLCQLRDEINSKYQQNLIECNKITQKLCEIFHISDSISYDLQDHFKYLSIALKLDRFISKLFRIDQKIYDLEQKIYSNLMLDSNLNKIEQFKLIISNLNEKKINLIEDIKILQINFKNFYSDLISS